MLVGIVGTMLGNIIAFLISLLLTKYKIITLPEDIYFMDRLPINIDYSVYLIVSLCAVIITFFASLYPSNQSAKLNIVESIRQD